MAMPSKKKKKKVKTVKGYALVEDELHVQGVTISIPVKKNSLEE